MRVLHDLTGADHDTEPPRSPPTPPEWPYVVCSTGRSGSGLLCRALAATGVLGAPLEYFNPLHREMLVRRWRCPPGLDAYLRALRARRTTRAGVFGTKLHWRQLVSLRAEWLGVPDREPPYAAPPGVLEQLLPGARYVRIVRLDVDRQAVSLWVASNTGTWSVAADETVGAPGAPVPYDFDGIAACRTEIENGEVHWDRFLRAAGAEPHVVVYEDLVRDYAGTVRHVAEALMPDGSGFDGEVSPPATRRLADRASEALYERFLEDPRRS